MTGLADWMKENSYYFLGPSNINRVLGTGIAAAVGTIVSMPFDAIRVRLYAQTALPNGVLPYKGSWDCFNKIFKYESNHKHHASPNSFYAGFLTQFTRFFAIFLMSQYFLDYYQLGSYHQELWASARYSEPTGIDFDIHEPYNMAAHRQVVTRGTTGEPDTAALNPAGTGPITYS